MTRTVVHSFPPYRFRKDMKNNSKAHFLQFSPFQKKKKKNGTEMLLISVLFLSPLNFETRFSVFNLPTK